MTVGDRIAERLAATGLSQSELARRLHVRQSTISGLIRGEQRSSTKLHQIARELGTTPSYLSGEIDDPELDASEAPTLTSQQSEWLKLFDALDVPNRAALMQIARTMVTGMNQPTVNSPKPAYQGEE
ncbi:hypothetical protein ASG37_05040 [Sphingomonas sp. Leaf407]|uniref:helix-turn-helix domain-containing protein n=1 Tax=unclassified Sphingomonas TaxID=196159 RepID=UPI0006FC6A90|nr:MULTISPECIES: helix-turn-helix transcriptional regulator [unclassified Sphingomonas]KQN37028.1 hypothetical protein ASE97_10955 [Sphingomonas sp. Leaf42]KQT30455.1 hypothetical protein ASG37_05040 [Sphingomonas sp. Leaf407]